MNCSEALPRMHEYLDGDLTPGEAAGLKKHLLSCPECNALFREMEAADALVKTLPKSPVPEGLTERIMNRLPAAPRKKFGFDWIKRHPAVSAASVFLLIMMGSFLSLWNQDSQMTVRGTHLDQLVIEGDTVYLPKGRAFDGDLMVRRGNVQIDGELKGNLVVVDGSYHTASGAYVAGKVYVIDQAAEWLLYQLRESVTAFAN